MPHQTLTFETIGKLVIAGEKADKAALALMTTYDTLSYEINAIPFSPGYIKRVSWRSKVFVDIVQLVALGMEVAHERPVCPAFKAGDLAARTMKAHGIPPKAAPRGKVK